MNGKTQKSLRKILISTTLLYRLIISKKTPDSPE